MTENQKRKAASSVKIGLIVGACMALFWIFIYVIAPPDEVAQRIFEQESSLEKARTKVDEFLATVPSEPIAWPPKMVFDHVEQFLQELSSEINSTLPAMIDQDTRFDSTSVGPGNRFSYFYTWVNQDSRSFPSGSFEADIVPDLRKRVAESGLLDDFFKDGTTVELHYSGSDGGRVGSLTITPSEAGF